MFSCLAFFLHSPPPSASFFSILQHTPPSCVPPPNSALRCVNTTATCPSLPHCSECVHPPTPFRRRGCNCRGREKQRHKLPNAHLPPVCLLPTLLSAASTPLPPAPPSPIAVSAYIHPPRSVAAAAIAEAERNNGTNYPMGIDRAASMMEHHYLTERETLSGLEAMVSNS
ncbi:hypothetical protein Aperf_G00000112857 [Anoplocephala perfoliata]